MLIYLREFSSKIATTVARQTFFCLSKRSYFVLVASAYFELVTNETRVLFWDTGRNDVNQDASN